MRKYTRNFWVRLKPIEGGIKVRNEKQNIYIYIDPIIAPISKDSPTNAVVRTLSSHFVMFLKKYLHYTTILC